MTPVLFCRTDSVYKRLGCDVWDESRDALRWPGRHKAIFHPPCRTWGRLKAFAKAPAGERFLAVWAVWCVRHLGGIVEHPAGSALWAYVGMPRPGESADYWGGYTIEIKQCDWGHPCEKLTWLYCRDVTLPPMPPVRAPTHVIKPMRGVARQLPICSHKWREATPEPLARWLIAAIQ